MTKTRLFIREFFVYAPVFLWIYALASCVAFWIYKDMGLVWRLAFMAAPFALMWVTRRYCRSLAPFLLLHMVIAAAAGAVFLTSGVTRPVDFGGVYVDFYLLLRFAVLLVILINSLAERFNGKNPPVFENGTAVFFAVSLAALCVVCEYRGDREMTVPLAVNATLVLAFKYLYNHMASIDASMELLAKDSQPVGAVLSFNNKLIAVFTAVLAAAAFAAGRAGLGSGIGTALGWLGRALRAFLRLLFGALPSEPDAGQSYVPMEIEEPVPELLFEFPEGYRPPSPVWAAIENILIYGAFAVLIIGAAAALIGGCYALYKRFYRKREDFTGDIKESLFPDIAERVKARFAFAYREPVNRVRRQFFRKVRRHIQRDTAKPRITESDTAFEMAGKIKASENIDALTARYEQARYNKS